MSVAKTWIAEAKQIARNRARGFIARLRRHPWSPPVVSAFNYYNASFDPIPLIYRYAAADLVPSRGYLTNFLGVKVDPKVFPPLLAGRGGDIEPVPIPTNWHADIAEWGGVLRAVDLAQRRFTIVEVGCGWGCWLNNAGAAARSRGLELALCGIEADPEHLRFAYESLEVNGFAPGQIHLHHGVAAAANGTALFPRRGAGAANYGLEPIFDASSEQIASLAATYDALPELTLADLAPDRQIDLLHIDIQGGELDFVRSCLDQISEQVAYMLIGTHSRQIEGSLMQLIGTDRDWALELERPAIFDPGPNGLTLRFDGVQAWRNLRLLPR